MTKFTAAVEKAGIDIVPKTVVNMGGGDGQGSSVNAFEMLMSLLVSEKLGVRFDQGNKVDDSRVAGIKAAIMKAIEQETAAPEATPPAVSV